LLSDREKEVLYLVATGASNKEIANKLHISTNTVKVHLRNILKKTDSKSRTEAAMYAVNIGLVSPGTEMQLEAEDRHEISTKEEIIILKPRVLIVVISILVILISTIYIIYQFSIRESKQSVVEQRENLNRNNISWENRKEMLTSKSGFGITSFEGEIFTIGGESTQEVLDLVEVYNPNNEEWEIRKNKPTPVTDVKAGAIRGKIYIPGGTSTDGRPIDKLEIYDPRLDQWSQGANLPVPLSNYALSISEGRIFLFGGWDGEGIVQDVIEYDPFMDEWKQRTPLPFPISNAGAVNVGGRIYIVGGISNDKILDSSLIYVPEKDIEGDYPYEEGPSIPEGRHSMGITSMADFIYIVGGENENGNLDHSELIVVQTGEWLRFSNPDSLGLSNPGLIDDGNQLYVMGGYQNGAPINQNWSIQAIYYTVLPVIR